MQLDGNSFLYTRHLNLYLVAVTRGNVNPAMVFEFLYQKIRIFKAYFKRDFDEDTLRNNMTLILELMDGELRLSSLVDGWRSGPGREKKRPWWLFRFASCFFFVYFRSHGDEKKPRATSVPVSSLNGSTEKSANERLS